MKTALFTASNLRQKTPWFLLIVVVLIVDQVSKQVALHWLEYAQPKSLLPFFNFTLLYNKGAAFSFLSDASGWQRWFFTVAALLISIFLIIWILRLDRSKKLEISGLSLILAGAIGNLWDRVTLGHVIDFIDWYYYAANNSCFYFFYARIELQSCHWPSFNIADSAIFIGVVLLMIDIFKKEKTS